MGRAAKEGLGRNFKFLKYVFKLLFIHGWTVRGCGNTTKEVDLRTTNQICNGRVMTNKNNYIT